MPNQTAKTDALMARALPILHRLRDQGINTRTLAMRLQIAFMEHGESGLESEVIALELLHPLVTDPVIIQAVEAEELDLDADHSEWPDTRHLGPIQPTYPAGNNTAEAETARAILGEKKFRQLNRTPRRR